MFECIRKTITHIRKTIWTHLNNNMKEQLVLLAGELGKLISSDVFEDGRLNISQQHKSITILKEIEPFSWIKKRNPLLNSFLEGRTSVNINKETNEKKVNAFAHSIEQVMYTRNLHIITPFSFKRNLVLYSVTNSKELSTMNKKWEVVVALEFSLI